MNLRVRVSVLRYSHTTFIVHVQRDGVVAAGGEQGGVRGVQAKVSDGFGGEVLKRSYWRKRMVPDGLVQRRIDQFSTRVPKLGEGVGQLLDSSSLVGRKRKCVTE